MTEIKNSDSKESISDIADKYEITIPDIKSINVSKIYAYEDFVDFEDMEEVNKALFSAKTALFTVTDKMNSFENKLTRAKTAYNREWRRRYLSSTRKTDTARKMEADLYCESLEDDVIVYEQVREDLKRLSNILRIELQSLQTISSNLRQQIHI